MYLLNFIKNYLALYLIDHGFVRAIYPNMHKVHDGLFRSSQPSPRQLANIKKKYGIKTIINLRGENGLAAYRLEKKACEELDLNLINFRIYSRNPPQIDEVKGLIEIYQTVEYPVLIHCKSGSDRTGIAAALYRILILNQTVKEASNELHWSYGHIKTSHTGVLDYFLERYVSHSEKQKISFLEWVKDYDPVSLKNEFRSSSFMSLLFDKIIKRE